MKFCPRRRSCPGQVVSSNKIKFLGNVLPQAAQLPRTSDFFKQTIGFMGKVLPLAAQLPRTSGSVEKKRPTTTAKGAERLLGGPGEPLECRGSGGRSLAQPQEGCGGAQPPHRPCLAPWRDGTASGAPPLPSHGGMPNKMLPSKPYRLKKVWQSQGGLAVPSKLWSRKRVL